jgi:hypothetical protein
LIWESDTNSIFGPTLADYPVPVEGNIETEDEGQSLPWFHFKSDAALGRAADRWAQSLLDIGRLPAISITTVGQGLVLGWRRNGHYVLKESESLDGVWHDVQKTREIRVASEFVSLSISASTSFYKLEFQR